MPTDLSIRTDFLGRLGEKLQLARLFDQLPDIYFFAKNVSGQFVLCNSATLQALGLSREAEMIGKTDNDIVPAEVADQYREADRHVMDTGRPVRNLIEPVPDANGVLRWYVTSKIPLFGEQGSVVGVAVAMRDSISAGEVLAPYQEMNPVMEYVFHRHHEPISVEHLAEVAGLSVRQFERRFKKLFGLTPLRYIHEYRLRAACIKLRRTRDNISAIAHQTGFYDHAHFVRHFKQSLNMTPTEYREQHQTKDE